MQKKYINVILVAALLILAGSFVVAQDETEILPQPEAGVNEKPAFQEVLKSSMGMDAERMVQILVDTADESKVFPSMVFMKYRGREIQCFYDSTHDRMRIISAISPVGDVTSGQFSKAMKANFHTALDARYAVNEGILYAAFIHPLSPLTREQVIDAMKQVVSLSETFGAEYTSGNLTFSGGGDPL